jgi:hypothetical protein
MSRRSRNAKAAANAQNAQRKTTTANRISLNLMRHKYNSVANINSLRTDAAEMKARHQVELATMTQRHKTERASLLKKHEIERKAHTVKMNRGKKIRASQNQRMTKMLNALRKS